VEQLARLIRGPGLVRTRALGLLMLAGVALAALTIALPPPATGSDLVLVAVNIAAAATGLALLRTRRELSITTLSLLALGGTAMITVATYEGGAGAGTADNEMLYAWVALYAFYFLPLRAALLQLVGVGVAYAALMAAQDTPLGVALNMWVITIGTLAVAGLLLATLRDSLDDLVRELTDRARLDGLTRLLNRNALEERAQTEFARLRRGGEPLGLLICDLDGFKLVNDNLGHPAGDQVLRRTAIVLECGTREVDAVARVGGDEFAVLLPDITVEEARAVGERLRLEIRRSASEIRLRLSASVGVAVGPECGEDLATLWQAADRAMYEAKHAGGDAVGVADAGPGPTPPADPARALAGVQAGEAELAR